MKRVLFISFLVSIFMSCDNSTNNMREDMELLKSQNERIIEKIDSLDTRISKLEDNLSIVNRKLKVKKFKYSETSPTSQTLEQSITNTSYSGRCQAITKKGTQCSRKAQAGRDYCWQH